MDIYGDIEGNKILINKVKDDFRRDRINVFLGDLVANSDDVEELNNAIEFIEWLITPIAKIEHKQLSDMKFLRIWNHRGLNLRPSIRGSFLKDYLHGFSSNEISERIFFIIGNKEVKLFRQLGKLNISEHQKMVLETYLSMTIPFVIINEILYSHSYYMYDDIKRFGRSVKNIIAGHSRSYGMYKFNGMKIKIIDSTEFYSDTRSRLIIKNGTEPKIKLISEDNFTMGCSKFYTPEFKLMHEKIDTFMDLVPFK